MSGIDLTLDVPGERSETRAARPAARRGAGLWRRVAPWLMPAALLVIWEIAARLGSLSPQILPAPTKVFLTGVKLVRNGTLPPDMGISLLRAAVGFCIGGTVGFSRVAELFLDRSIQMLRAIPFLALLPLVIVWFGIGEGAKVFLIALGVLFPIYINTVLGIRQVDPKLVELGRVTGLSTAQLIRRIVLPGALPSILTGVRYALASAWLPVLPLFFRAEAAVIPNWLHGYALTGHSGYSSRWAKFWHAE